MHWVLDVVFGEDKSRIRIGNATENMSFTRHCSESLVLYIANLEGIEESTLGIIGKSSTTSIDPSRDPFVGPTLAARSKLNPLLARALGEKTGQATVKTRKISR